MGSVSVSDDDVILGALTTLSGGQTLGRYALTPVGRGGMAIDTLRSEY